MQELFRSGQLGDSYTKHPSQLLRTAWSLLLNPLLWKNEGRKIISKKKLTKEAQRNAGSANYIPRKTVLYELPKTTNGKVFEVINSSRCPVSTIENQSLKHLNPKLDWLFQRLRELQVKFNPEKESIWDSPVIHQLENQHSPIWWKRWVRLLVSVRI